MAHTGFTTPQIKIAKINPGLWFRGAMAQFGVRYVGYLGRRQSNTRVEVSPKYRLPMDR
jgi:hypothetical protein